jgi:hypothetical protein
MGKILIQSIERGAEEMRKAALSTSIRLDTRKMSHKTSGGDHSGETMSTFSDLHNYTITLRGRSASPPIESLETAHICTSITNYNSSVSFPCILLIGGYQISSEDHPLSVPAGCQERVIASVSEVVLPFADLLFVLHASPVINQHPESRPRHLQTSGRGCGGDSL